MNKKVLEFTNKCEGWKTAIKNLHWGSRNMSQHELCDKIADRISDFQDQVSEVEQALSGNLPLNKLKPISYKISGIKKFVEDVIDDAKSFLKSLEGEGDDYIGMRSDCESFLSDMQRNLYLVNFTLKEELKRRLIGRINESMPKNPMRVSDGGFDKFVGRRPKSVKARINQIYKIVKKYGIDSRKYNDDHWQAIEDYHRAISSLGCDIEMKPCADVRHFDSLQSDGGYTDYDPNDNMPRSKQWAIRITFEDGMSVDGYIKCMAAGTVEDPLSSYDTCIILWPKTSNMRENKDMSSKVLKLTESELRNVIKEATMNILSETPLNYDADNFSGKWSRPSNGHDWISGDEYFEDADGDLDDRYSKNEIESALADDEWEWGEDMTQKDAENEYSWDRFENKPIAHGVGGYYTAGKRAIPTEIGNAIYKRNRANDWSDRELRHGSRMMDKWVSGKRDAEQIGDSWEDMHEGKKMKSVKLSESELSNMIKEASMRIIKEKINIDPKNKGKFTKTQKETGKSTEELTHSKNPLTRKRANFAKMAKRGWKPLKESEYMDDGDLESQYHKNPDSMWTYGTNLNPNVVGGLEPNDVRQAGEGNKRNDNKASWDYFDAVSKGADMKMRNKLDAEYLERTNNSPFSKTRKRMDMDDAFPYMTPNERFKQDLDKQWNDTQDKEKYSRQADSRPLHRRGSLNRA